MPACFMPGAGGTDLRPTITRPYFFGVILKLDGALSNLSLQSEVSKITRWLLKFEWKISRPFLPQTGHLSLTGSVACTDMEEKTIVSTREDRTVFMIWIASMWV